MSEINVCISTILFSDEKSCSVLRDECRRVADKGGKFSIRNFFETNWWTEFTIVYPDDNENKIELVLSNEDADELKKEFCSTLLKSIKETLDEMYANQR